MATGEFKRPERRRIRGGPFEALARAALAQSIAGQLPTPTAPPPPVEDVTPASLTPDLSTITLQLPQ